MAAPAFSLIVPLANLGGPDFPYRVKNVREMLAAFPRDLVEVVLVEQVVDPALPTFAGELGQAPGAVWETARHGQFCKGWLYNLGARRATGRHLVFAESDCLPENPPAYFAALHERLEERGDAWLIGWSEIIYLGPDGRSVYRRAQPQKGFSEGGLLVVEHGAFAAIGGANEFFLGLGGMDNEIVRRLETQGPHQTFPWRMVHRYHPESALKTSMDLRLRNAGLYEYIRFNPAQSCRALAGLMRERRDWSRPLAADHTWAGLVADDLAAKAQEAARRHQAGELDQAEFLYRQIIAAQPGDPAANYNLALIGLRAGCPLDSLAHLGRAAQASPGAAGVAYAQGLALEQARRLVPAGEAYARALRLDPGLAQAQTRVVAVQEQQRQEAASAGPVRVGLLTALWQRPELTRCVLGYYGGLNLPGVELVLLAVGSEGEASRGLAQDAGWAYVEAPNSPLSRKWQAGLHALRQMNPDYVCLVGSDDLISPGYLPQAVKLCPPGGAVGLHDIMFLDLASGRMGRYSETTRNPAPGHQGDQELYVSFGGGYLRTLGAGRVYSRAMLDRLGWVLWPQDKDRSLDAMAEHHILAQGLHPGVVYGMGQLDCLLVDVKSGHNLWGFEKYRYCQVFTPEQTRAALARQGMAGVLDLGPAQAPAVVPDRPVAAPAPPSPSPAPAAKVGRNDPCPCGSGKKYKRCCLAAQRAAENGAGAEAAAGVAAG